MLQNSIGEKLIHMTRFIQMVLVRFVISVISLVELSQIKAKSERLDDDLEKIIQTAENDISLGNKNDNQIVAFNKCLVPV